MKQYIQNKRNLLGGEVYMFLLEEMKQGEMKLIVNENSITDKLVIDGDKGKLRKFIAGINEKYSLDIFIYSDKTQNEIMLGVMDAFKSIIINNNPVNKEEKIFTWNLVDGTRKVENATVYTFEKLEYKESIVLG